MLLNENGMNYLELYQQQHRLNRIYPKSVRDVIRMQSRLNALANPGTKFPFFLTVKEPKVYTCVARSFAFIETLNQIHAPKLDWQKLNSLQKLAAMDLIFRNLQQSISPTGLN
jgi:hypothetical protein